MKHEEKKKDEDEGPKFDERGEPLVIFKRTCPAMNNADLAARASFFAAMRAMSDEDFKAGRGLTFQTMVREDPRYPARQIQFVFGIRPRTARTYAERWRLKRSKSLTPHIKSFTQRASAEVFLLPSSGPIHERPDFFVEANPINTKRLSVPAALFWKGSA